MNRPFRRRHLAVVLAALFFVSASGTAGEPSFLPAMLPFANPTGIAAPAAHPSYSVPTAFVLPRSRRESGRSVRC